MVTLNPYRDFFSFDLIAQYDMLFLSQDWLPFSCLAFSTAAVLFMQNCLFCLWVRKRERLRPRKYKNVVNTPAATPETAGKSNTGTIIAGFHGLTSLWRDQSRHKQNKRMSTNTNHMPFGLLEMPVSWNIGSLVHIHWCIAILHVLVIFDQFYSLGTQFWAP